MIKCLANYFQIWANKSQALHNPPSDLLWKEQEAWAVGPDCNTVLYKPNGKVGSIHRQIIIL